MSSQHIKPTYLERLQRRFKELGSAVVAFSGGVDSALLTIIAHQVLGRDMVAVTIDSPSLPHDDRKRVVKFCKNRGIPHQLVAGTEFQDENFLKNPHNRCYFCKRHLYDNLIKFADELGFEHVVEGTNISDMSGHRPGAEAAKLSSKVVQPLKELGIDKEDVRTLANNLKLSEANKPATACLSSRIPFETRIEVADLGRIDRAESYLKGLGIHHVRVRAHGKIARIESDEEGMKIAWMRRKEIASYLKKHDWSFVALDLDGYRPATPDF